MKVRLHLHKIKVAQALRSFDLVIEQRGIAIEPARTLQLFSKQQPIAFNFSASLQSNYPICVAIKAQSQQQSWRGEIELVTQQNKVVKLRSNRLVKALITYSCVASYCKRNASQSLSFRIKQKEEKSTARFQILKPKGQFNSSKTPIKNKITIRPYRPTFDKQQKKLTADISLDKESLCPAYKQKLKQNLDINALLIDRFKISNHSSATTE